MKHDFEIEMRDACALELNSNHKGKPLEEINSTAVVFCKGYSAGYIEMQAVYNEKMSGYTNCKQSLVLIITAIVFCFLLVLFNLYF